MRDSLSGSVQRLTPALLVLLDLLGGGGGAAGAARAGAHEEAADDGNVLHGVDNVVGGGGGGVIKIDVDERGEGSDEAGEHQSGEGAADVEDEHDSAEDHEGTEGNGEGGEVVTLVQRDAILDGDVVELGGLDEASGLGGVGDLAEAGTEEDRAEEDGTNEANEGHCCCVDLKLPVRVDLFDKNRNESRWFNLFVEELGVRVPL